jgi:uncharacterized protein YukE
MNINIDTEKLLAEIEKLEKAKESLNTLFTDSVRENTELNEEFQSDTSRIVDEEFKRFDGAAKEYIEKIDSYINYLKDIVTASYIDYEVNENKLIDENIATN